MPFPQNPTNNQSATVNNISYTWNSTKGAWVKTAPSATIVNTITATSINVSNMIVSNVTGGNLIISSSSSATNTAIGYLSIPQNLNPLAANTYTLALTDQGKHIYLTLTSANANSANIYIPTTANVPFPTGAAVNIVLNGAYSANVIANSGVTMYLAGNTGGITGSNTRILAPYSMASVLCVAANTWYIAGVGVS